MPVGYQSHLVANRVGIGHYCLCTSPLIWILPGPVISFPGDKQHCDMT